MCFNKCCESYRKSIRRADVEEAFEAVLHQITPAASFAKLDHAMFFKAWNAQMASAKRTKGTLRHKVLEIEVQIDQKLDQIVECTSTTVQKAFERKIEKLEADKLILQEKLRAKPAPKRTSTKCSNSL